MREDAVTTAITADIFTTIDRLRVQPGAIPVGTPVPAGTKSKTPGKIKGESLKGPVPLSWLTAAAKLRGKAPLAVALAVWFEAGRRRSNEARLTTAILNHFSVNRKAKYTGLAALEKAGLSRVHRHPRTPAASYRGPGRSHPARNRPQPLGGSQGPRSGREGELDQHGEDHPFVSVPPGNVGVR